MAVRFAVEVQDVYMAEFDTKMQAFAKAMEFTGHRLAIVTRYASDRDTWGERVGEFHHGHQCLDRQVCAYANY